MNANSKPKALSVKQWLIQATAELMNAGITSARLDAELILSHTLKKDRTWLVSHSDEFIQDATLDKLKKRLDKRLARVPMAYITGHKEFYGRDFLVDPHVLIPRPETEEMIELILSLNLRDDAAIFDVGTGSGCIAITLKCERPNWNVSATDISESALNVTRENAAKYKADITFQQDDLISEIKNQISKINLIAANLPYVAPDYEVSPDARAEPHLALFADDDGYALINQLIEQSSQCLEPSGFLVLESDPWQQDRIIKNATDHGFILHSQRRFHLVLQKT